MKLWHIGYLTDDVEKTVSEVCSFAGIEGIIPSEISFDATEVTKGTPFTVKCANVPIEGTVYEFVQPVDSSESFMAKELERRGKGVHHAAYELKDEYDDIVNRLISQGWTIGTAACKGGNRNCFVLSPDGAICYELIENIP